MKIIYFNHDSDRYKSKIEIVENSRLLPIEYRYKKDKGDKFYRLFFHNKYNYDNSIYSFIDKQTLEAIENGLYKSIYRNKSTSIYYCNKIKPEDRYIFSFISKLILPKYILSRLYNRNHYLEINLLFKPISKNNISYVEIIPTVKYRFLLFYHSIKSLQPNSILLKKIEVEDLLFKFKYI